MVREVKILGLCTLLLVSACGTISPVVLIPGDGGSQLEGRWHKEKVPHIYCTKTQTSWSTLWVAVSELLPGVLDCWADTIAMDFDPATGEFSSKPGVEIRAPGFGGTETVEYLSPSLKSATKYFYEIADSLTKLGLQRGSSIRGAPYDFRYAGYNNVPWQKNLTALVEETFALNNNTRVTLVAHSLGCLYTKHFLHTMPSEWKAKFLHAFVPISGPWTGTLIQMRLYASGYADLVPGHLIDPLSVRPEQRSWASNVWLLPVAGEDSSTTWTKDEVLVQTPSRNYTAHDYFSFFHDIPYTLGNDMYQKVAPNNVDFRSDPGVDTYCLYGNHVPTEAGYVYPSGYFPDKQPNKIYGDGDGTVNLRSLHACSQFATQVQTFPNVSHTEVLSDAGVLKFIKGVVTILH